MITAVCLGLSLPTGILADAHANDQKRARICAGAEKRYQELFSRPSADEDTTIILMHKYTFCPSKVSVKRGTTVRWVNVDKRTSHSVWFKVAGKTESDRLFGGDQVEITFDGPTGDYPYLCGPHWKEENMTGLVTVRP
ncbi:MAG: copper-binding protein [Hyphomicrobiales bacterium]|nr:copper-binding protein [Hyphomicrobiales bacterium]